MRGPLPYQHLNTYPHLTKHEAPIWDRFITLHPDMFKQVYYDVPVGNRREDKTKLSPEWARNANYLGAYKIDVVGETDDYIMVLELKKEATSKALGEVWLYEHLLKKEWKTEKPVFSAIITDVEMPNIREVAESDGVQLFVVGKSAAFLGVDEGIQSVDLDSEPVKGKESEKDSNNNTSHES